MIASNLKHFFHRAGFGVGQYELKKADRPIGVVKDELLQTAFGALPVPTEEYGSTPVQGNSIFGKTNQPAFQMLDTVSDRLDTVRANWIKKMSHGPDVLREKMALFWHNHFACQCYDELTAKQYIDTLRRFGTGNFRHLLHQMAKSPAMILFLNNQENIKDRPNENFAREVMELFTMGRDGYSEQDVKEGARAFSGWSCRGSDFVFRPNQHDNGVKTFLGIKGRLTGEDILEIILDQPQTPVFLADKLFRYFVNNDVLDREFIKELAREIKAQNYEMLPVLEMMFSHESFYATQNRGTAVKSPVYLIVHLCRLFHIEIQRDADLGFLQRALGQQLLYPPNVAGWEGGRAWINNTTLMLRLNLAQMLLKRERFDLAAATPLEAMEANRAHTYIDIVEDAASLTRYFSGTPYDRLEEVTKDLILAPRHDIDITSRRDRKSLTFTRDLMLKIVSLPEFQLC